MRRLAAWGAIVIALALSLAVPPAAVAADPTFQAAKAAATFGQSIQVEQEALIPAGVRRVEAVVRAGPNVPTFLSEITKPGEGQATLRYTYPTPKGSLFPNSLVELGFRITLDDGRTIDGPTTTIRYEDNRFTWRTVEGSIVRVHWYAGDAAFGQRALDIGERAVKEGATLLGVSETDPIDFYIYADRDAFYDVIGPGLQENVGGLALVPIRTLFANIGPSSGADPWVGIVVPHELTHIVFGTATDNVYHDPPHWLNEGLADYVAVGYDASARSSVDRAGRAGELMPLRALRLQFPSTASRFSLGYDESVSAIDFMVRAYGKDALVKLIRSYADGVSDDAAFSAALGVDLAAFESAWLADLGVQEPVPYGPVAAPAGPVPPGWSGGPAQTPRPGVTGPPATIRPANPSAASDMVGPALLGVVIAFVLVLAAGLFVTARRLNRGEPLLAPVGAGDTPAEVDLDGSEPEELGGVPKPEADPPQPPAAPATSPPPGSPADDIQPR